ncbi:MAG: transcription-repair coupling factor [Clostridia bacterium]|nr:transcription-repair coupling factor [Clostridia bacterium]
MTFFDQHLQNLPEYQSLLRSVQAFRLPAAVGGLSHIHKAHLTAVLGQDTENRCLIITADEGEATRFVEDLAALGANPLLFPAKDLSLRTTDTASLQYEQKRLDVLCHVLEGDYTHVVCSLDGLLPFTLPPDTLYHRSFTLEEQKDYDIDELCKMLIACGYTRCNKVEGAGQFARRGGILDLFPADKQKPIRLEFWGETIDTINEFDILTQRREETMLSVQIPPAREVLFPNAEYPIARLQAMAKKVKNPEVKERLLKDADALREGVSPESYDRLIPLLSDTPCTLFDYTADALVFVSEAARVREKAKNFHAQLQMDVEQLLEEGVLCKGLDTYALSYEELCIKLEEQGVLYLEAFGGNSYDTAVKDLLQFNVKNYSPWGGSVDLLTEDLSPLLARGFGIGILAGGEKAAKLLAEDLTARGLPAGFTPQPTTAPHKTITVTTGHLSGGLEYTDAKFLLVTHTMADTSKRKVKKVPKANAFHSLDELHAGDYIVHAVHGIGQFKGIRQIQSGGVTKDYITIAYAGSDTLYVPVTQLDLVSKYIGPGGDDVKLKLHKLGGTEWQKTRTRVRHAVRDMAKELIALYSARMNTPGYAFEQDTDLQNDFERRFAYEETDDQLRCIDEIKYDMQRAVPMDRLLCGDVGFGKTEVALRAAFKCMAEGKQCALLVPTTILAFQHYQTVLRRVEGFPLNIDLLSRFRTPTQQAKTIQNLRAGNVDMVIGTHRLISNDVQFKDLGLVIIDEEQRFGVAQKEKLKEKFKNVDVLTLSATPIPRTLNMAMSGLRDMSIIEEAPGDRQPVQTYVMEYNKGVIHDAIRRELRRGGQVYYLHNRVEDIERVAAGLKLRIPEANVGIAHGKMNEEQLSDVWRQLVDNEIDLLVCTTIIETGVDVPNANTLIIENADTMGLAQLHQLRGRVGRSSRRAYAYFTFRGGKALSDIATRRLDAIREFTQFGSGLKIAMRDLEIRGAGNLLGGEQHGQMESVGYDMYLKLLEEAVQEEKTGTVQTKEDCMVDMQIEAHIPEGYIDDLQSRLEVYRRIADIRNDEDASDVIDELIDRFGPPPEAVMGLIHIAELRNRAAALGITEAVQRSENLLLYHPAPDVSLVLKLADQMKGRILLNAGNKPYISVKLIKTQTPMKALESVLTAMEKLTVEEKE